MKALRRNFFTRRQVLTAGSILAVAPCGTVFAATGEAVYWGGVGFGVSGGSDAIKKRFPSLVQALNEWGNFRDSLKLKVAKNYPGGMEDTGGRLLSSMDDPGLLLVFSLDFEQNIVVADENNAQKSLHVCHLYGSCQVIHFEIPRQSDDEVKLAFLYSFPVRVSRTQAIDASKEKEEVIGNVRNLLIKDINDQANSLVGFFGTKLQGKVFKQYAPSKFLTVSKIGFTDSCAKQRSELGLDDLLSEEFFGQALTSSIGMQSGAAIVPFGQTETLSTKLAAQFDKNQAGAIKNALEKFKDDQALYKVNAKVLLLKRSMTDSTAQWMQMNRTTAIRVELYEQFGDEEAKLLFTSIYTFASVRNVAKLLMPRIKEFDQRYFLQDSIALFEKAIKGITTRDMGMLKAMTFKPERFHKEDEINKFADVLQACQVK